jgi:hypothetical protein
VHPYREQAEPPDRKPASGLPSEEWFLIGLCVVIGGARFFVEILAGETIDAEGTLGFFGLALGLWFGIRGVPWLRRRRLARSGKLHDANDSDPASRA